MIVQLWYILFKTNKNKNIHPFDWNIFLFDSSLRLFSKQEAPYFEHDSSSAQLQVETFGIGRANLYEL